MAQPGTRRQIRVIPNAIADNSIFCPDGKLHNLLVLKSISCIVYKDFVNYFVHYCIKYSIRSMEAAKTSQDIWAAFISGNDSAFHSLYKQHYVGLINYATKLTADRDSANEHVIQMFLDLWEKQARLPLVNNVRSYLLSCLRRTILQTIRSEKLRQGKENYASKLNADEEGSYEDYLFSLQTQTSLKYKLARGMKKLTGRQKEILELKFYSNLDYDEIAVQCNISKRTAYNIVFNSIQILKKEFDNTDTDGNDAVFLLFTVLFLPWITK
jgi:RNA polymerase sigma factor (sigma-70 family)